MPPVYNVASLAERQAKCAPLFAELRLVLPDPESQLITDPKKLQEAYSSDKSFCVPVTPAAAVLPSSVEQVAAVVRLCAAHKIPMTPRGAGTGLEGGAIALTGGVVIDAARLQRMDFDVRNAVVWVGAGVRKLRLMKAAREHGLLFGPDPSSNPCVGGMVATSGSGMTTLKYGTTRENVLALRVVTPQGNVMDTRRVVRKTSSGLDLTQLYCGSEGTLGVLCEVAFKLWPLLLHSAGGVATFDSTENAVNAVVALKLQGAPTTLLRCELLNKEAVEASNKYSKLSLPVAATVFLEFSDSDASLRRIRADFKTVSNIFRVAGKACSMRFLKAGDELDAVWEARRGCFYAAMQVRGKPERVLTTDVCVPLTELPAVIRETEEDFAAHRVPCLVCAHISDGNFHLNVPFGDEEEYRQLRVLESRLTQRALARGGTISGEHGVGVGKLKYVTQEHGETHIRVQEAIKAALDPDNLMNPGIFYPNQQRLCHAARL
ncbi:D-lactate dehydrogenase-like protein [Trypanosoma conorhini]|uniref:D-lactate dehydrogenase (cytochrome) n=1 Tax=Trypanosoma conorhini TaxID=83891 RepID=A0A422NVR9_9TRYP|nr:D-lactate dehydrogenase-like protein [Trypanosoma conorhini]RNF09558.1 D-lactate dehydrogenase-like protein [Trypanosoma conorhini]